MWERKSWQDMMLMRKAASHSLSSELVTWVYAFVQVQTRYLGRNWRRSNMKTISAIYRSVRHHLHDDWAYGNDLEARPWDFQQQVRLLNNLFNLFDDDFFTTFISWVEDHEV